MKQFTKTTGAPSDRAREPVPQGGPHPASLAVQAAGQPVEAPAADGADSEVHTLDRPGRRAAARVRFTPYMAVSTTAAVVLLGAVAWHLTMVFLTLAPANSVTNRYQRQINGYIHPEFGQNWQMFAPNPLAQNVAIGARVQTRGHDGSRHTWDWVNLSAPHLKAMRHNPFPSHLDQNVLRRSWDFYTESHDPKDKPTNGMRSALSTEYLTRIALQYFGRNWNGEKVVRIQLASRTNAVPPPKWTGQKAPDTTAYRILPWWPVTEKYYKEL